MHPQPTWYSEQAALCLSRLLPGVEAVLGPDEGRSTFESRLHTHFPTLFRLLHQLYGSQYDLFFHLEQLLLEIAAAHISREPDLRKLDAIREQNPVWFQDEQMMGGVCYVDRFAGNLAGIREQIPYFREMGLTYLHLMPLFKVPEPNNDGGYAVSSFREVNPKLGTMQELRELASELRENGIGLVLDFVFNHTSDEHEWAQKALGGDRQYQAFYWMFDDRTYPDQYERHLREIFPEHAPGSFTFREDLNKWVWTTFYPFQWDLNYRNPAVFRAMLGEILFLANQGVEILRLDAVPFIWKQLGTNCENLPETHTIIQALNACVRIAAPALLFKSEAIVHPRDVRSYISAHECQLSYNPIMMVSIWEALATRSADFFRHTIAKQFPLPDDCAWINYLRSHDDIGWGFADEDAEEVGIAPNDHRYFLNLFYTGRFPKSFAAGVPFNFNLRTLDMRISGSLASLAGLERALRANDPDEIDLAIRRIIMIFGVIMSAGGIPLIYLGDEIGTLNDYSFENDPLLAHDNRWIHRPRANPAVYAKRTDPSSVQGRIYQPIQRMIKVRKQIPAMANGHTRFIDVQNAHVLSFVRHESLIVMANFSEKRQVVPQDALSANGMDESHLHDLIQGHEVKSPPEIVLEPYQIVWLERRSR